MIKLQNLYNDILEIIKNNGGEDIVTINLKNKPNSVADHIIIVTGTSTRHSITLAEKVAQLLKKAQIPDIRIDGLEYANWIAIDSGKILIHIFLQEVREYYKIEKIWL